MLFTNYILAQPVSGVPDIEYRSLLLPPEAVVFQHPRVDPSILSFDFQARFGRDGVNDEVVVAMRAVFIAYGEVSGAFSGRSVYRPFFKLLGVFAEALLALLACKGHVQALQQRMVFLLMVTLGAVKPFAAYVFVFSGSP